MRLGDQILDDNDGFIIRPWVVIDDGWLVCLMCPMAKETRAGRIYYRAVNTRKKTRRQARRWVVVHRRCGFEGLS